MTDIEGYGEDQRRDPMAGLLTDIRELSPSGVDRIARAVQARDEHAETAAGGARHRALQLIQEQGRDGEWDEMRRSVEGLTTGENRLIAWRPDGADEQLLVQAVQAASDAALAVCAARAALSRDDYEVLVGAVAEAIPWLLTAT